MMSRMTLVPLLTFKTLSSAVVLSEKEAWKAVGKTRLTTLKLRRQALI
jgi:very-short-patch-repair endonuclease